MKPSEGAGFGGVSLSWSVAGNGAAGVFLFLFLIALKYAGNSRKL